MKDKKTDLTEEELAVSGEPTAEMSQALPEIQPEEKGTDELIRAYLKLEAEFRALFAENAELKRINAELTEKLEKLSLEPDYGAILSDEKFIEEYAARDSALKARIIADYLSGLSSGRGVSVLSSGTGSTPLTPAAKPKSLAEAKKLAEILIKG